MAPKQQAAARAGATSNPRRNPSRHATSPSSVSDQMRVTKLRAQPKTTKSVHGPLSKTQSQTRSHGRVQSSDDELLNAEDFEEPEESLPSTQRTLRRSARAAPSTVVPGASGSRANQATLGGKGGDKGAGTKNKPGASNRTSGKSENKQGRKTKALQNTIDSDHDSDELNDDASEYGVPPTKITFNTSPPKSRRGQPTLETTGAEITNSDSVIPNWLDPQIEHSIWVQIFQYAAVSGDEQDTRDANWLLRTARVCRQFADPALTVLYKCPPVRDEVKAQGLADLLEKPPSMTAVNYRAKIEALHIDVRLISLQGFTSPARLMQNLPRLSEVLLVHGYDQAPYRLLKESIKWTYPTELFQAFEVSPTANAEAGDKTIVTRLRSWQWSSRLMDKNWESSLVRIKQVHKMPSFASLRKLKLVNYQLPSARLEKDPGSNPELLAEDKRSVELIADSISALENIEDLVFESSTIVCSALLPLLPGKLKRLELVNCAAVTAVDLGSFLLANGHRMESLVLHHNRSLNLGFLPILSAACPHLKELRMNLQYFSLLETIDDSDPYYDQLLLPDQVPSWPTSLEIVHLENLRHWSTEAADTKAAEGFLQSFIDSARELPVLRYLSIKAMLNISWRSRSEFRRSWQEKFEKVFLRRTTDPKPHFTLRKPRPAESSPLTVAKRKSRKPLKEPSRRSNRIVSHASGTSSRASSTSRELRGQQRKPQSYLEPDSDEFDSDSDVDMEDSAQDLGQDSAEQAAEGSAAVTVAADDTFIQGMCRVVDINIDNQKPREHQYSMDDFLNDEADFESDGEWDGDMDFE
ncbi:hypothetical protein EsH8_II_001060 [Colletotrichum jinshuiense]